MCTGCGAGGSGFCAAACPAISCPLPPDAGGEGGTDGGGCPASASTACVDCAGATYCVAGACPLITCQCDGGAEDGSSASDGAMISPGQAPGCTGTPPAPGQSCTQPQGCTFEGQCAYCAPSAQRIGPTACGSSDHCQWASTSVPASDPACPRSLPTDGAQCGSSITCRYCETTGLFSASCSLAADTYTWSVSFVPAQ